MHLFELGASKLKRMSHVARVSVTVEFSHERGDMHNLAYIDATVLNFGLAWPQQMSMWPEHGQKLKNVAQM